MPHSGTKLSVVLRQTFGGYGFHLSVLLALGVLGAILDAVSINAIVPLLSFLIGSGHPTDVISLSIQWLFTLVHVPYKFRYLLVFVGLLVLLRALSLALFAFVRARVNASFLAREISGLTRATLAAAWEFIVRQKAGYLQNTVFWDAKRATILLDGVAQVIQSSTGAIIYLIVAVNISPVITLMTLAVGSVLVLILRPLITRTRHFGAQTAETEKTLAHRISEYLQGFKAIKASGAGVRVADASEGDIARLRDAMVRTSVVKTLSSIFVQPASFLFIMVLFAVSYTTASFNLASFAATIYLIQKIFTYVESTQTSFYGVIELVPFAENITRFKKEIAGHREEVKAGGRPFSFERSLELRGVSLSYGTHEALRDISLSVPKGTMLGIVGPSGGGKTSVADVILRLFKPSAGLLLVDGESAETIRLADWRRAVAYVSQDAFLMHASVRDNIRFFDAGITDAQVESAARDAHIYEAVMRLPQGFDTVVGDRGATLSGGERQRVALAGAVARAPQVLVLDEVTSALDSELEAQIREVIAKLRGKTTLIVIAHRISTVLDADAVIVLEKGRIVEEGEPKRMLENPDSYLSRVLALQRGER